MQQLGLAAQKDRYVYVAYDDHQPHNHPGVQIFMGTPARIDTFTGWRSSHYLGGAKNKVTIK